MLRIFPALALSAALLAGCSDFPELDNAVSPTARKAGYPSLLPIDQLIAGAKEVQITEETISTLQSRIARLNARAARLRGPVIDAATRARMRAAIARHR
jgi:outer membrane murein-binding lipoprotein Lpp